MVVSEMVCLLNSAAIAVAAPATPAATSARLTAMLSIHALVTASATLISEKT